MLLALVVSALLTSCNGRSRSEDTLPPAPSTTTTTIDVSKVPPTIDVPYVQAVMDALDQRTGDMVRVLVANKLPNAEFYALMRALYDDPQFSVEQSDYGNYAARGLGPLSPTPQNPTTIIKRIIDASSNCIVADLNHDYGPIFREPVAEDEGGFIQLRLKRSEHDPLQKNPTPWAIIADIDVKGARIPEDPCK